MICCAASAFPSDFRTIFPQDVVERVEDLLEALECASARLIPRSPRQAVPLACVSVDMPVAELLKTAGVPPKESRSRVIGLVERDGRVVGVRAGGPCGDREFFADLVVGADGRYSTV